MFFRFLFLLLLFFTLFNFVGAQSYLSSVDSLALMRIRAASGGGTGVTATGWMSTVQNQNPQGAWLPGVNPTYNWTGLVFVNDQNGNKRVKEINLSGFGLIDSLPGNLFVAGAFDSLEVLDVSSNNINSIGYNLWFPNVNSKLRKINISNNTVFFDPNIFIKLCSNANALEELLAESFLSTSGLFPSFPQLPNLKRLILGRNFLSGVIPNPYSISPSLVELNLESNNFQSIISGTAPAQLQILNISYNNITSITDLRNILATYPVLKVFIARDALDNVQQHGIQSLYTAIASDFSGGKIDIGSNNLVGPILINNIELTKLREFKADFNQLNDIIQPQGPLDSLRVLNLSFNQIFSRADTLQKLVMFTPKIEVLNLSNNNIWGRLPSLTIQNIPQFPPYANLKVLNLSNNSIYGKFKIGQLLGAQLSASNGVIQQIDISNNLFDEIQFNNINQTAFDSLSKVNISRNKLSFRDLYILVKAFGMRKVTSQSSLHYYAPANALFDSLAFDYQNQLARGVGGLKRRPANDSLFFDSQNPDPKEGLDNSIWNSVVWYQSLDSVIDPSNDLLIGSYIRGIGAQNFLNGFTVSPQILGTVRRNILKAESISQQIHGGRYYYAIVSNDSFPLVQIPAKPKKLVIGDCFDFNGRVIKCQEMMVSFDRNYLNNLSNPDSVILSLKEELGIAVLDSCLCGTYELWEISDTSNTLLLENLGTGTRTTTGQANNKAELLSADPNYALLGANVNSYTASGTFASGSQHPNPSLVAIVDSGCELDHPNLTTKIYVNNSDANNNNLDDDGDCLSDNGWGWNFIDNNNYPFDDHGHGTAIAGIVSGQSTYNVYPNSGLDSLAILPLKYTAQDGKGSVFYAACAVRFAADFVKYNQNTNDSTRVKVINASWGYYGEPNLTLQNAIEYAARKANIVFVCSAGNESLNNDTLLHYPSNYELPNILTVAASQSIYSSGNPEFLEPYSNYGSTSVDIAAPGFDFSTNIGTGATSVTGTSFAAAQVSRAVAMIMHKYPDATYCAVIEALIAAADPLNSADSTKILGGRLNIQQTMSILDSMSTLEDCSLLNSTIPNDADMSSNSLQNLYFYPNPFTNQLHIDFNGLLLPEIKIEIISFDGRVLFNNLVRNQFDIQIDLSDYASGIYLLKMSDEKVNRVEKIIKQP